MISSWRADVSGMNASRVVSQHLSLPIGKILAHNLLQSVCNSQVPPCLQRQHAEPTKSPVLDVCNSFVLAGSDIFSATPSLPAVGQRHARNPSFILKQTIH